MRADPRSLAAAAEPPAGQHRWWNAAIAAGSTFAAATIGSIATMPHIPGWYDNLAKPWFNPPNWVFGPAWTLLFILMAVAFWRVLQLPADTPGRPAAIAAFAVQLVLNALWSICFFGLENPLLGLVEIVPFWISIVVTIVLLARLDRVAAWLLAPYIAWVSFAAILNAAVWWLNR